MTLETVGTETPACSAMNAIVVRGVLTIARCVAKVSGPCSAISHGAAADASRAGWPADTVPKGLDARSRPSYGVHGRNRIVTEYETFDLEEPRVWGLVRRAGRRPSMTPPHRGPAPYPEGCSGRGGRVVATRWRSLGVFAILALLVSACSSGGASTAPSTAPSDRAARPRRAPRHRRPRSRSPSPGITSRTTTRASACGRISPMSTWRRIRT